MQRSISMPSQFPNSIYRIMNHKNPDTTSHHRREQYSIDKHSFTFPPKILHRMQGKGIGTIIKFSADPNSVDLNNQTMG